uniref:BTB domain-containing protein n=1 Tax=Panagrolaimus davidi TaxID=227884 RepID=A0A914QEJ2_9BILA
MIPDALNNFRTLLMFLYTGNINTVNSNNETLLNLVKLLQVPELEEQLRAICEAKATSNIYAQYFLQAQLASSSSSPPNFGMSLTSMTPNLPSPLEANDAASFDR